MDRYAVIGNPIAHSKSPQIHAAFARATGEDIEYSRILAPLDGFAPAVAAFRAAGGRGLNVTLPFKEEAFQLADDRSARAVAAGVINTLRFDAARVHGDNTDGLGIVRDITVNLGVPLTGKQVLLAGAGGAARGVIPALLELRPAAIVVVNRTLARAEGVAARFGACVRATDFAAAPRQAFDIVVNATSASLAGELPPLPPEVYAGALAYDMVYAKDETPFLAHARRAGAASTADGLGMLVEQAAESFFVWRGVRPATAPVAAMLRALL